MNIKQEVHEFDNWVDSALQNIRFARLTHAMVATTQRHHDRGEKYGSIWEPVLDVGWVFEPAPLPEDVPSMTKKECFSNAQRLSLNSFGDLVYVEGYAQSIIPQIHHAWCTDEDGHLIDPTWDDPESPAHAYIGIPFDFDYWVNVASSEGKQTASLLDNYEQRHPLHREGVPEEAFAEEYRDREPKDGAWPIECFLAEFGDPSDFEEIVLPTAFTNPKLS